MIRLWLLTALAALLLDDVEKVALLLLEKETITHDDVDELVGPRPFAGDAQYDEFVRRRKEVLHDTKVEEDKKKDDNDGGTVDPPTINPGLAFRSYDHFYVEK